MGPRAVQATLIVADVAGFTALTERLEARGRSGSEVLTERINGILDRILAEVAPAGGAVLKFGGDSATVVLTGRGHRTRGLALAARMRDRIAAGARGLEASIGVASGRVWLHVAGGELIPAGQVVTDALAAQASAAAGEVRDARDGAVATAGDVAPAPPPDLPDDVRLLLPGPPTAFAEHRRTAMGFVRLGWGRSAGAAGRQRALERALPSLLESCERHGVSFLQSDVDADGCKLLVAAGALRGTDRPEERLAAVLTETVAAPPAGLVARAGMSRGAAFVADVGGGGVAGVTLMSDAVNVAARLSALAETGTVLAAAAAAGRLPASFATGPPRSVTLSGRRAPVTACTVSLSGATAARAVPVTRLVGRDAPLRRLRNAVRQGGRVTVAGPAGIGKTRLLDELVDRHDGPVVRIDGALHARAIPYLAVRGPLHDLTGLDPREAARETGGRPELRRARLHAAVLERLEERLGRGALIAADDVQWLDDASRALLNAIAERAPDAGWSVVEARRAEPDGTEEVALGPLSSAATRTLVDALVASAQAAVLPPEKQRLAALAAGHPLLCEELVVAARAPGAQADTPETAEALLGARLDALGPADRRLVRELAVLGARVELDVAAALVALERAALKQRLGATGGLLVPDGPGAVRFRHDLVRQVAYEGLPFARRRDLHARAMAVLADRDAPAELLSGHADAAGDARASWHWSRIAGERALEAAAPLEALVFLRRAAAAGTRLRADPDARRAVLERLADAQERVGALEDAARTLARARRLDGADPLVRAGLCFRTAELWELRGSYRAALAWNARARAALAGAPDDGAAALEVRLDRFAGGMRLRQGRARAALDDLLRAQAGATALGLRAEQAEAALLLSWAYSDLGDPRQVEVRDVAVPIYAELGDDFGLAKALTNRGSDLYFEGEWDAACEDFEAAAEACRRIGDWTHLPYAWANVGEIRVRQGRLAEVRDALEEARRLWRSSGYAYGVGMSNLYLGYGALYAGSLDDAAACFTESERALRESESGSLGEVHAAWVELHARRGDVRAARAALRSLPEHGEGPIEIGRRHLAAAQVALAAADVAGARASAQRAVAVAQEAELPYDELCALSALRAAGALDAAAGRRLDDLRARLGVVRDLACSTAQTAPPAGPG